MTVHELQGRYINILRYAVNSAWLAVLIFCQIFVFCEVKECQYKSEYRGPRSHEILFVYIPNNAKQCCDFSLYCCSVCRSSIRTMSINELCDMSKSKSHEAEVRYCTSKLFSLNSVPVLCLPPGTIMRSHHSHTQCVQK